MLVRFEAANFRSIQEPAELSMVAVDGDREAARPAPHLGVDLLTVAAVYGPNASGKTNVVAALSWVCDAVRESLKFWDELIPIEPFASGEPLDQTSEFVVESVIDGIRFEYHLEVDREHVHYEALFHYPEKKRRRIFERTGSEVKLQRGLGRLSGVRELLTERSLVLSAARRFNEPLVSHFVEELLHVQILGPIPRGNSRFIRGPGHGSSVRWFEEPQQPTLFDGLDMESPFEDRRGRALGLLRLADLGIEDVSVERETVTGPGGMSHTRRKVRLHHKMGGQKVPMDFSAESEGIRTWFALIGPILTALEKGGLVLMDELDSSLHPTLAVELLRLFQSSATNPNDAQLIFTTHDTSLLNHLNRDEVWLTEKNDDGATVLGALAEFAGERVRKSSNLENAYLHGRFGALPQVDKTEFLRALGLIG